ncbi:MAG: divergent PAP2 family protein [Candidatus Buchananbacteria bacterium]|nr:divergent PAP2 family protein [Candidatus Buchananbacteria bacterium]
MFELLLIPIVVALITQIFKLIIDGIPNNLNWQHLINDYGGMPSSHTSFVSSLATVVGLSQGFDSAAFAISLVLMLVVMRDAIGFRREIGRNAVFTNMLATIIYKDAPPKTKAKIDFLNEKVGHSLPEVIVGFIVGTCLSLILYVMLLQT